MGCWLCSCLGSSGPEPVVTFKGDEKARYGAIAWASEAMMKILAAAKTVGPDRWIAASREDPYDDRGRDSTLWLVAYEDADPSWAPDSIQGIQVDGYLVQTIVKLREGFDISAMPSPLAPSRRTRCMPLRAMEQAATGNGARRGSTDLARYRPMGDRGEPIRRVACSQALPVVAAQSSAFVSRERAPAQMSRSFYRPRS